MGKGRNIYFESKKESNKRRRDEAINRPPEERLNFFLKMIEENIFQVNEAQIENKNNFVIK